MINFTIFTVPVHSTTRSFSSVINESNIFHKTIMSTLVPVNSTTISTCSVVSKVGICEVSISTICINSSLQVDRSTTFSSNVIHKSTIIYTTIRTNPNNSTTVTTISNNIKCITSISNT